MRGYLLFSYFKIVEILSFFWSPANKKITLNIIVLLIKFSQIAKYRHTIRKHLILRFKYCVIEVVINILIKLIKQKNLQKLV